MTEKHQQESPKKSPNSTPRPTNFGTIIAQTNIIYKKYFWIIVTFMLIPALVEFATDVYISSGTPGIPKSSPVLIFVIASWGIVLIKQLASYLGYGGAIYGITESEKSKKPSFRDGLIYGFRRLKETIILAFRILIYTFGWLFIILLVIIGAPSVLKDSGLLLSGMNTADIPGLTFILTIALIVAFVIMVIRLFHVVFAYPLLLVNPKMTSAEALEQSLKLSNKMVGTIFVNYLFLGIIFAIIGGIYGYLTSSIFGQMFNISGYMTDEQVWQYYFFLSLSLVPFVVVLQGYSTVFQITFAEKAIEEKEIFKEKLS